MSLENEPELTEALLRLVNTVVARELSKREDLENQAIIESDEYKILRTDVYNFLASGQSNADLPTEGPAFEYMQKMLIKGVKRGYFRDHPNWHRDRANIAQAIRTEGKYLK